jgi:dienelactone hydrolase
MLRSTVCLFSVGLLAAQTAPDPAVVGRKALDLMLGSKFQELNKMFTPEGQKVYTAEALGKLDGQIKAWGAARNNGTPTVARPGPNFIVTIPVSFASQNINFTIAVNPAGEVVLLLQRPGESAWQPPPYAKTGAYSEHPVTVGEGEWKLPGLLTLPAGNGPFPGVVLVHDTGPSDHDETVFATKVFGDLAEGLATNGVASLRYEKRTRQYAAKMANNKGGMTVRDETDDDALKAIALLRTQPQINPQKIYLLGHGLGGYLAPRIAQEDGKLAGIVILNGTARPLEDVMLDQAVYLGTAPKELEQLKLQAARVKALEPADSDSPRVMGMTAAYILDLKGYDPVAVAKSLSGRILVIQGERDFQATMKDFNLWKTGLAGRKDATFRSYPALNHLSVAGQGKSTEAEYRKPGHVAQEVVDEIAKWAAQ